MSSSSRIPEESVFCHYHHAHQQSVVQEEVGEASLVGAGKADLYQHLGCLMFLMTASMASSNLDLVSLSLECSDSISLVAAFWYPA